MKNFERITVDPAQMRGSRACGVCVLSGAAVLRMLDGLAGRSVLVRRAEPFYGHPFYGEAGRKEPGRAE